MLLHLTYVDSGDRTLDKNLANLGDHSIVISMAERISFETRWIWGSGFVGTPCCLVLLSHCFAYLCLFSLSMFKGFQTGGISVVGKKEVVRNGFFLGVLHMKKRHVHGRRQMGSPGSTWNHGIQRQGRSSWGPRVSWWKYHGLFIWVPS
jgi:hypothetical protein